jgi:hypothetical protein
VTLICPKELTDSKKISPVKSPGPSFGSSCQFEPSHYARSILTDVQSTEHKLAAQALLANYLPNRIVYELHGLLLLHGGYDWSCDHLPIHPDAHHNALVGGKWYVKGDPEHEFGIGVRLDIFRDDLVAVTCVHIIVLSSASASGDYRDCEPGVVFVDSHGVDVAVSREVEEEERLK